VDVRSDIRHLRDIDVAAGVELLAGDRRDGYRSGLQAFTLEPRGHQHLLQPSAVAPAGASRTRAQALSSNATGDTRRDARIRRPPYWNDGELVRRRRLRYSSRRTRTLLLNQHSHGCPSNEL